MFDIEIDVLMVERIEKELKKLRNKRESQNNRQDLSLYSNEQLVKKLKEYLPYRIKQNKR